MLTVPHLLGWFLNDLFNFVLQPFKMSISEGISLGSMGGHCISGIICQSFSIWTNHNQGWDASYTEKCSEILLSFIYKWKSQPWQVVVVFFKSLLISISRKVWSETSARGAPMSREIQSKCLAHNFRYLDLLQESKHINNYFMSGCGLVVER